MLNSFKTSRLRVSIVDAITILNNKDYRDPTRPCRCRSNLLHLLHNQSLHEIQKCNCNLECLLWIDEFFNIINFEKIILVLRFLNNNFSNMLPPNHQIFLSLPSYIQTIKQWFFTINIKEERNY